MMIQAEKLAGHIITAIKRALEPRDERIATLERKLFELEVKTVQLERRPLPKWAGTFEDGKAYSECSLITDRGSMWVATRDTAERPGSPNSGWKLIVKRGNV